MSDFTYFRIGVPNDMVADIMWNDEFEVSIESYSKHETNYQRYFGTPEKAAETLDLITKCCTEQGGFFDCLECPLEGDCELKSIIKWLESEEE